MLALLFSTRLSAQSHGTVVLKDVTAKEVVQAIEKNTAYRFSYLEDVLPQGTYSLQLDLEELDVQALGEVLGLSVVATGPYELVLTQSPTADAESYYDIGGYIVDSDSRQPIIGATLQIGDARTGTATDENGHYLLAGRYRSTTPIVISYLGYSTLETTVGELAQGATIRLAPKGHILDDIVIRSQRQTITSRLIAEVIRPEDMELPSAPDKDVFALAQAVPGVYNSSESLTDLQIRGGTPDQVSYNWGGIRLFQNSLFYGRVSAVNPFMVDQINITRNGASADEHASASGAINMDADLSSIDTTQVRLHLNGLYANIGVETALLDGRLQVRAAYRRSLTDVYPSPIYDNYFENSFQFGRLRDIDYFLDSFDIAEFNNLEPEFSFSDQSLSVQYQIDSASYLRANVLSYGNLFTYRISNDFNDVVGVDSFQMDSRGAGVEWRQQWTERLATEVTYSGSTYTYFYFNTEDVADSSVGQFVQENRVQQQMLAVGGTYQHPAYTLSVGYNRLSWQAEYGAFSNRPFEAFVNELKGLESYENSYYANAEIHAAPWYRLILGLRRSDYNLSLLGRSLWEPRLHGSVILDNNWAVHAHYGRFHQNLNRRNFGTPLDVDNGFWLLSDERLDTDNFIYMVQSEQLSAGIKYSRDRWSVGMDVYQKQVSNLWTSAFDFGTSEDRYEFADLAIHGVELAAQYRSGAYTVMASYDYVRDIITTEFSGTTMPSPFTQPHRLMVMPSAEWGRWTVSSQWHLSTGRAYSLPRALVTFINEEGNIENGLEYDDFLTEKVANYSRVDLGVRYQLAKAKHSQISLSLQIMNVLGRDNIIKQQYYINYYQAPRIATFDHRGLPRMWDFAVDVTF